MNGKKLTHRDITARTCQHSLNIGLLGQADKEFHDDDIDPLTAAHWEMLKEMLKQDTLGKADKKLAGAGRLGLQRQQAGDL